MFICVIGDANEEKIEIGTLSAVFFMKSNDRVTFNRADPISGINGSITIDR